MLQIYETLRLLCSLEVASSHIKVASLGNCRKAPELADTPALRLILSVQLTARATFG